MHYLTLVAVDVDNYPRNKTIDASIEAEIVELKKAKADSIYDNVLIKCRISELRALTNSFARAVDKAVEERLEPYCECTEDPRYLKFEDRTDEFRLEYDTETIDCVKLPGGKTVPMYSISNKFVMKDGFIYQKHFGPLKHEKRSKRAKRMTALPQYPCKKLYKTFQEYVEQYYGAHFNEEQDAYGYYSNPDSFWDWYRIGGRWPCSFLVKSDCAEYAIGDYDDDFEFPAPPEGYIWTSAARKKDIQWDVMIAYKKQSMLERFNFFRDAFEKHVLSEEPWLKLHEDGVYTYDNYPVYLAGETFEECLKRRNYLNDTDFLLKVCYYVDAKYWHSDSQIWFSTEQKENEVWQKELADFYHSLSENTVLVSVDCHD